MNVFVLDTDPRLAAVAQCDSHVVKMTLETAQLLCGAFAPEVAPYKPTHQRHPCALWTRASMANFIWLAEHGLYLADEYQYRYGKEHKSREVIAWCLDNWERAEVVLDPDPTPFAQAMPDEYKNPDPVAAYRAFYRADKASFARWAHNRPPPAWWTA